MRIVLSTASATAFVIKKPVMVKEMPNGIRCWTQNVAGFTRSKVLRIQRHDTFSNVERFSELNDAHRSVVHVERFSEFNNALLSVQVETKGSGT